jgi:hypothetical protein
VGPRQLLLQIGDPKSPSRQACSGAVANTASAIPNAGGGCLGRLFDKNDIDQKTDQRI